MKALINMGLDDPMVRKGNCNKCKFVCYEEESDIFWCPLTGKDGNEMASNCPIVMVVHD